MKKIKLAIILLAGLFMIPSLVMAQSTSDEVTLVVSADGATKEEATKVALRSAIEQAYGTFVSANTTILNDELVKDEIVTVSQGNIKSYSEIASERTPDGKNFVTLRATVCISKLVSYAKSKGASTEFAGATFAMNIKIAELNRQNERKAINNLVQCVKKLLPNTFDYELKVSEPTIEDNQCVVSFTVTAVPNANMLNLIRQIKMTLISLSLPQSVAIKYKQEHGSAYPYRYGLSRFLDDTKWWEEQQLSLYPLRTDEDNAFLQMNYALGTALASYEIVDNLGNSHTGGIEIPYYSRNGVDYGNSRMFVSLFKDPITIRTFEIKIPVSEIGKYSSFTIRKRGQQ